MGVNKYFIFLLFMIPCVSFAGGEKQGINSIELTQKKAMSSSIDLAASIKKCTELSRASQVPSIDFKYLYNIGVNRKSAFKGLYYLSNKNFKSCEGINRIELAYHLGTIEALAAHYKVEVPPIKEMKAALIYPTYQEIEAELDFINLPKKAKGYLINLVGDAPFDFVKTLSSNKVHN